MLIPSLGLSASWVYSSLSRRVNANSQLVRDTPVVVFKLIKKGEC